MNRLASDSLHRQPAQAEPATHAQMSAGKTSTTELASAIYQGTVQHRRHSPHPHAFSYRMAMLYLDLAEIDQVFAGTCAISATASIRSVSITASRPMAARWM